VVHSFSGADGANPSIALIADSSGALYGVTANGGAFNLGTVFRLAQKSGVWTETVLHSFVGTDGVNPMGVLLIDQAGALYGSTTYTQTTLGTVFKLSLLKKTGQWKLKTLRRVAATFVAVDFLNDTGAVFGTTTAPNAFFKMTPPKYNSTVLIDL